MPGEVALDDPRGRIIGFEGDDDEAEGGEENDVATGRVAVVEGEVCRSGEVEGDVGLLEEGEVVAVEMDLRYMVK